jgi:hypothetical protein
MGIFFVIVASEEFICSSWAVGEADAFVFVSSGGRLLSILGNDFGNHDGNDKRGYPQ